MTALRGSGVSMAEVLQTVMEIVRTMLDRDDIEPSVDVFDQGATSLAFIRIVAKLNERYDITLDVAGLAEASVDSLSALVEAQTNAGSRKR